MNLEPSEKETQAAILEVLGLRNVFCWRNNTGAIVSRYNGKERFFRFGARGSGDILGMLQGGIFFSIEVKAKGKKPTPLQQAWIDKVNESGGVAFVAYSVDDVEEKLHS